MAVMVHGQLFIVGDLPRYGFILFQHAFVLRPGNYGSAPASFIEGGLSKVRHEWTG